MPTGDLPTGDVSTVDVRGGDPGLQAARRRPCPGGRRAERGFTYLLLLLGIALAGAGLAALGTAWSTAGQRVREAELRFRGGEYARALAGYRRATPVGLADAPGRLEDLLEDRRSGAMLRHLRRLYADPFTGGADWVLVRLNEGVVALHSRSSQPLMRPPPDSPPDGAAVASDWWFSAEGAHGPASLPAEAEAAGTSEGSASRPSAPEDAPHAPGPAITVPVDRNNPPIGRRR